MLAILFPHMYEDVQYLLPTAMESDEYIEDGLEAFTTAGIVGNAVAGPSRLRSSP